ncbi:MAG: hydrolase, partial [Clostridiales bacterium]|nr:hydrolase [Clostridiales bacterium]
MRYIKDFKEGEMISEIYLCKTKQALKTKAGKNYYSLLL